MAQVAARGWRARGGSYGRCTVFQRAAGTRPRRILLSFEIQTVQRRTVRIIMESLVMVEAGQPCFDV